VKTIEEGLRRFQDEVYPRMAIRFRELAAGQSPTALFITCSDSRIDPTLITQAEPGNLFVLRNPGNFAPRWGVESSVDATVEFAVDRLGVQHIIVCGHSGCGAIVEALKPDSSTQSSSMRHWVRHAAPSVDATAHLRGEERVREAIAQNVSNQLDNLISHPAVARAVAAGTLALHGWMYDIASGQVANLTQPKES
jgi:carbonic anhydrase